MLKHKYEKNHKIKAVKIIGGNALCKLRTVPKQGAYFYYRDRYYMWGIDASYY